MGVCAIILAAGKGTRMSSDIPKVLHCVAGRSMLSHVINSVQGAGISEIVLVVGFGGEAVENHALSIDKNIKIVYQKNQLGTANAVECAKKANITSEKCIILYGDVPLISSLSISNFLSKSENISVMAMDVKDSSGYGRIISDNNLEVSCIVEEKEATTDQKEVTKVNTGIFCVKTNILFEMLKNVTTNNSQGEFYLTDIVKIAKSHGLSTKLYNLANASEAIGVNSQIDLANAEKLYREKESVSLMAQGVKLTDPTRIDIRGKLTCGKDVIIDVNVIFEGTVHLGDNVIVGANSIIKDTSIGSGTIIKPFSMLEGVVTEDSVQIGPFCRLREGTVLKKSSKVGNFMEIKNSIIGIKSKAMHLSYVGDAEIGSSVNIGAGTIFCNYDGKSKHKTFVGDGVFIGSNTEIISPVKIGSYALVAAGSSITKNVLSKTKVISKKILITKPLCEIKQKEKEG